MSHVAIIRNWRRYGLPHVACGFINEADFGSLGSATLTFGNGEWVEITDRADIILTTIPASAIEE